MADNTNDVEDLLRQSIEAQNRTTHAVRAFVRFLFIQLTAITVASGLVGLSFSWGIPFLAFLAAVVAIVGVIWSSFAGWSELELSDRFAETRRRKAEQDRAVRAAQEQANVDLREQESARRRAARQEWLADPTNMKRLKRRSLLIALVAIVLTATVIVIVAIQEPLRRASLSDAERFTEDITTLYETALAECANEAGISDLRLRDRFNISGDVLTLTSGTTSSANPADQLLNCVARQLTGNDVVSLGRGEERSQGEYVVSRSGTGVRYEFSPSGGDPTL